MSNHLPQLAIHHLLMVKTLGNELPVLPFAREIFLLETHVAGLPYHDAGQAMASLTEGAELLLRREPDNPHDELAIEILTSSGIKLGYVPRIRNPVLARLMDAGKTLLAHVARVQNPDGGATAAEIRLRIALRDL